jgi:hypothetical protein
MTNCISFFGSCSFAAAAHSSCQSSLCRLSMPPPHSPTYAPIVGRKVGFFKVWVVRQVTSFKVPGDPFREHKPAVFPVLAGCMAPGNVPLELTDARFSRYWRA